MKVKGFQVAPAELEAILRSHPAVADAAVIPVPDERAGELPKAYVVPAQQITPQELIDYVAARVAPHKRIHQVSFTDAIPTSPSGKTLRRLLIAGEQHRSRTSASSSSSGPTTGTWRDWSRCTNPCRFGPGARIRCHNCHGAR